MVAISLEQMREEMITLNERPLRDYLEREEAGDAELFARRFQNQVVFDHSSKDWYKWRGNFWERDRKGEVYNMLNRIAEEYSAAGTEALKANDKRGADDYLKRARALLRRRRAADVLKWVGNQAGMSITGDEWDCNPMLLGVNNGVLDLQTGELRPGQPSECMRVHSPIDSKGIDYPAERWEQFLLEVFDGEIELVNFMQRLLGYCLTGLTTEHRLPILWGEGRNGKSTLLQALAFVFGGDLSHTTQADALMDVKRDGAGAQPFVYALRGRRLVWATESREGQRINAGLIKQLTGGDSISTRTLYSDVVTFNPTHTVMLLTNHKPHADAEDTALWDRVLLIPFVNRFVDNPSKPGEYKRKPQLLEELKAEASGILAWLVRGCLLWQAEGLNPPAIVNAATEAYRTEEDTVGAFRSDCLIDGPDNQAQAQSIYTEYLRWCDENGEKPMSMIALGKRLKRWYGDPVRSNRGNVYSGVGVLVR